jgi:hypothetical protein
MKLKKTIYLIFTLLFFSACSNKSADDSPSPIAELLKGNNSKSQSSRSSHSPIDSLIELNIKKNDNLSAIKIDILNNENQTSLVDSSFQSTSVKTTLPKYKISDYDIDDYFYGYNQTLTSHSRLTSVYMASGNRYLTESISVTVGLQRRVDPDVDFFLGLDEIQNNILDIEVRSLPEVISSLPWKSIRHFKDGYAVVKDSNDKYGVIDNKGRIIIKPRYNDMSNFRDGKFVVQYSPHDTLNNSRIVRDGHMVNIIELTGESLLDSTLRTVTIPVGDRFFGFDEGWYIMDLSGKRYNDVPFANLESDYLDANGLYIVKNDKHYGIINLLGDTIAPFEYDSYNQEDAFIVVQKENNMNDIISIQQSKIIGRNYIDYDVLSNSRIALKENDTWQIFNNHLEKISPKQFEDVSSFNFGISIVEIDNKFLLIDTLGNEIQPLTQ